MRFSIIIPTYNRPDLLDRCLQAISALTYPKDQYEILIVDDGSAPPVDRIIARYANESNLRLYQQQNRGPAVARNLGLRHATGDFIAFTDDDCRPAPDWLHALEDAFAADPNSGWGGAVDPAPENGIFGDASQLLVSYLYNYTFSDLRFFCTNNIAFPRQELLALGGFDENFPLAAAEDRDLCDRWSAHHSLRHAPGAVVLHHQALHFRGYLRQHFRYGRGAFHFHTRRNQRRGSGVRIEPVRFYSRMLRYPFRTQPPGRAVVLSALIGLSQGANIAGFFYERSR